MTAKKTFEQAMQELEEIVRELEAGELPLETAMKKFEDGIKLSNFCSMKLEETERKISALTRTADGALSDQPFLSESRMPENQ